MASGNPRTITIPDVDFKITLDVASLYEPNIRYAVHNCRGMFNHLLSKEDLRKVAKGFGHFFRSASHRKDRPDIKNFNPRTNGTIEMDVQAFNSEKFYHTRIPFIEKHTKLEKILGSSSKCECDFYKYTKDKKDFDMCKHQIYGYAFASHHIKTINNLGVIGPDCAALKVYSGMSKKFLGEDIYGPSLIRINNSAPKHVARLSSLIKEYFPKD